MSNNDDIPFQILNLIAKMNDRDEPDHIRYNYMMRLYSIQHIIGQHIEKYKSDRAFFAPNNSKGKSRGREHKKIS